MSQVFPAEAPLYLREHDVTAWMDAATISAMCFLFPVLDSEPVWTEEQFHAVTPWVIENAARVVEGAGDYLAWREENIT